MKKFRGLRRRYKKIQSRLDNLVVNLNEESWYNFYHIHLDWKGITDYSTKNRRSHIKWYLAFLDKIEDLTRGQNKPFQTWIILDSGLASADAIYFHTENPHGEFPIKFDDYEWDIQANELLKDIIDLDKYNLGRCLYKDEFYTYCIQKKGLGISLTKN